MSVTFRLAPHFSTSSVKVVEILLDGAVCGVIYPRERGIEVVSAHIAAIDQSTGEGTWPPIPSVEISFDPRPYRIVGGRIVKE